MARRERKRQAHLRRPLLMEVWDALRTRSLVPLDATCPTTVEGLEQLLGEK